MKKNSKKVLIATCLLLVSAVLLGTASFAWFGMNTDSTASGLEVTASSDSFYLLISEDDIDYAADFEFTGDTTKTLGLATYKFFNETELYTISNVNAGDSTVYYDGATVYYVRTSSDKPGEFNYIKVELTEATDTEGYFRDTYFEKVTTEGKVGTDMYFELSGSTYTQVTGAETSTKGLYKIYCYKAPADSIFKSEVTYYSYDEATATYSKLDTSDDTTFIAGVTDMSNYFVKKYDIANDAEIADSKYNGKSTYYKYSSGNKSYTVVSDLTLGTLITDEYYTATFTQIAPVTATQTGDASTEYYLLNKNGKDYTYVGTVAENQILENYLYWARSYSNDPALVEGDNTLNVTDNGINAGAVNYYLQKTVFIKQANGTNNATNLRVSGVEVGGLTNDLTDAMRVLFVATSSADETAISTAIYDVGEKKFYDAITGDIMNDDGSEATLFAQLLGDEAEKVTVQVYIYFEGKDDAAKNTDAILTGQTVEFTFAIDDHEYNK